jgi:hypothetical protein
MPNRDWDVIMNQSNIIFENRYRLSIQYGWTLTQKFSQARDETNTLRNTSFPN